jgi:hypothetical protein
MTTKKNPISGIGADAMQALHPCADVRNHQPIFPIEVDGWESPKQRVPNMSAKQIIATATTIAFVAMAVAANATAAELKQLPITGDWVDVCDISGVRTASGSHLPPPPPGFPAPPTVIEVSLYSNHPVLINIKNGEDVAAIKEEIAHMRESSACQSGEKNRNTKQTLNGTN